jgi:hypothetical protein
MYENQRMRDHRAPPDNRNDDRNLRIGDNRRNGRYMDNSQQRTTQYSR